MTDLTHLRLEYSKRGLSEEALHADPVVQFQQWLKEAIDEKILEPYAMSLCTVSSEGQPAARIVLLRRVTQEGFQFFTNYQSRKGDELAHNPKASLLFYWGPLERQVRIEGVITKTDAATSDDYFTQRPRASQIAAVASAQSMVIGSRAVLESKVDELTREYEGRKVPRPDIWGGYNLKPQYFEFWQGRPSRLHDRLCYRPLNSRWTIERLSP